jgi:hypothetical protein
MKNSHGHGHGYGHGHGHAGTIGLNRESSDRRFKVKAVPVGFGLDYCVTCSTLLAVTVAPRENILSFKF